MGSGALIRGRVKVAAGSKRTASQLHCMLSSDCACQSENGLLDGLLFIYLPIGCYGESASVRGGSESFVVWHTLKGGTDLCRQALTVTQQYYSAWKS